LKIEIHNMVETAEGVCKYSRALQKRWPVICFGGYRNPTPDRIPWRLVVMAVEKSLMCQIPSRVKVFVVPPTTPRDPKEFLQAMYPKPPAKIPKYRPSHLIHGRFFWMEETLRDFAAIERYIHKKTGWKRTWDGRNGSDGKRHISGRDLPIYTNMNERLPKELRDLPWHHRGEYRHFIEKPGPDSVVLVDFRENTGFTWDGRAWTKEIEAAWTK